MKLICVVVNQGRAVKVTAEGESSLEILQALVGGFIEYAACGLDGIDPWIHEEGLYVYPQAQQDEKLSGEGPYCGPIVYAGNDGAGETISLTPAQVKKILGAYK